MISAPRSVYLHQAGTAPVIRFSFALVGVKKRAAERRHFVDRASVVCIEKFARAIASARRHERRNLSHLTALKNRCARACQQIFQRKLDQVFAAEMPGNPIKISRNQIPWNKLAVDGAFRTGANRAVKPKFTSDLWHTVTPKFPCRLNSATF
jgi:hypothetical protein